MSPIHETALIGEPPEHRDWKPGDPVYPPQIDPTARIEAYVTVEQGLRTPTKVGANAWLMSKVHVGHDAVIGDGCELAPMTSVGGHVQLGRNVRVGMGATFKPFVKVGDGARIGMGAVVVKDVPPGEVWAGCPARPLRKKLSASRDESADA
jgi:UDP-N-acetylglucosamine acyltransferase